MVRWYRTRVSLALDHGSNPGQTYASFLSISQGGSIDYMTPNQKSPDGIVHHICNETDVILQVNFYCEWRSSPGELQQAACAINDDNYRAGARCSPVSTSSSTTQGCASSAKKDPQSGLVCCSALLWGRSRMMILIM